MTLRGLWNRKESADPGLGWTADREVQPGYKGFWNHLYLPLGFYCNLHPHPHPWRPLRQQGSKGMHVSCDSGQPGSLAGRTGSKVIPAGNQGPQWGEEEREARETEAHAVQTWEGESSLDNWPQPLPWALKTDRSWGSL